MSLVFWVFIFLLRQTLTESDLEFMVILLYQTLGLGSRYKPPHLAERCLLINVLTGGRETDNQILSCTPQNEDLFSDSVLFLLPQLGIELRPPGMLAKSTAGRSSRPSS